MKKWLAGFLLLAFAVGGLSYAVDSTNIGSNIFVTLSGGTKVPALVGYTTDGSGALITIGSSASAADTTTIGQNLFATITGVGKVPAYVIYTTDGSGALTPITGGGGAITSYASFHTGNGYGSSSTKIKKFTTTVTNNGGTDFTATNSATTGLTVTINTAGIYSFSYCDLANTPTLEGLTKNASSVTTGISATAAAEVLTLAHSPFDDFAQCSSWTGPLIVNDVIRPHTQGDPDGADSGRVHFSVSRVR